MNQPLAMLAENLVATIIDEEKAPGRCTRYTVNFDASNLPSGLYL